MQDDNRPPAWRDEFAAGFEAEELPESDVVSQLDMAKSGDDWRARATSLNIHRVLAQDTRWVSRIRLDAFASRVTLDGETVTDERETEIALWIARVYRMDCAASMVAEQVRYLATQNAFHPVREYLEAQEWDGLPRVDAMLARWFGAADTELHAALGRCFLLSCVARVYQPGCKVDTTLILVGRQGARKSTALRVLAVRPEWYADTHLDLGSKDVFEQLQGRWIYELAELDAFRNRDWARIKALITSPADTWRRPYGRHTVQIPRQVVLAGTTNEDEFLGDPTGARRFWPVRVGDVDLDGLAAERDQLWAEALVRYRRGEPWYLTGDLEAELKAASAEFQSGDAWDGPVRDYLLGRSGNITVSELLEHAIGKAKKDWTNADQQRIAAILKRLEYRKRRQSVGGKREVVWER